MAQTESEHNAVHRYSVDERVYARQRRLTEKALFDYYMISYCCEEEVHTPFPFYLDKSVYMAFIDAAQTLDGIVRRIISSLAEGTLDFGLPLGDFPCLKDILRLKRPLQPYFWARYDAFEREGGGIFFSEFNYDKPSAQRETLMSEHFAPQNNPNEGFSQIFYHDFSALCDSIPHESRHLYCAVLVSPSHEDEIYLAHLFMDMLKGLPVDFTIAGPENIVAGDEEVTVFGRHTDIILRQYPTEKLFKIANAAQLLRLFDEGKVTIINDPRVIAGQIKSLFAVLWRLAENNHPFLSHKERQTILHTIPKTVLFEEAELEDVRENREKYVLKAVYSRYSEQVYIGKMMNGEQWDNALEKAAKGKEPYIIQEFCPIRKQRLLVYDGEAYVENCLYGNIGVYLSSSGKFSGLTTRWSPDYLSSDCSVYVSPIGVKSRGLHFANYLRGKTADEVWNCVNDEAAFSKGYTGGYTGEQRSFSLDPLILDSNSFGELKNATESISQLFHKTALFVKQNSNTFCPLLGIPTALRKLIEKSPVDELFIGRFDWVMDTVGNWKLLEFNSETPAGIIESGVLNGMILSSFRQHFGHELKLSDPNADLLRLIRQHFGQILAQYEAVKPVKTIGIVSCSYEEDWYNTDIIWNAVNDLPYEFVRGEISSLHAGKKGLTLNGRPIDVIYSYYPHDWFYYDNYFSGVIPALSKTFGIIPSFSIIEQSKAFFALVWELRKTEFYTQEEARLIDCYLPFTSLSPDSFTDGDTCVKPYFGREGENVDFAYKIFGGEEDVVFQQRIEIGRVPFHIIGNQSMEESAYPVVGAFVFGKGEFGGIYTRIGARVTDKRAVYAPVFVKNNTLAKG